jgi:competence protein ComEC
VLLAGPAGRCEAGQRWEWDGVRFEVLHPTRASYGDRSVKDNDRSCVLKIEAAGGRTLLPADIERRSEMELHGRAADGLRTDILLAPHQGSRTSSSPRFVKAVSPRVVIFPVGYRNRFGHPHREVVRRYLDEGARVYRTDRDGAVTMTIHFEGAISVTPYRALYRRYWQTTIVGDPVPEPLQIRRMKDDE